MIKFDCHTENMIRYLKDIWALFDFEFLFEFFIRCVQAKDFSFADCEKF